MVVAVVVVVAQGLEGRTPLYSLVAWIALASVLSWSVERLQYSQTHAQHRLGMCRSCSRFENLLAQLSSVAARGL